MGWSSLVNTISTERSGSGLVFGRCGLYHPAVAGIALEHVSKEFSGGVLAVNDVSLAIGDGEFVVLVGPSGCGKSTLLRMIAGLEEVSAGSIAIGERDVTELAPRHRDIAMVFQTYALYPHMTVRDNLGYGLKVRRTAKAGDQTPRGRGRGAARVVGAARAAAGRALGRPAPARRDGSRDRPRAASVPHGRAALEPRRQAPRRHARVARAAPRTPRRNDGLRHPRPDRGDDARSARGRHAKRPPASGGVAAASLPRTAEPFRRGVHRLTRDEPRRGDSRRRLRRLRAVPRPARGGAPAAALGPRRPRHPPRNRSRTRRSRSRGSRRSRSS